MHLAVNEILQNLCNTLQMIITTAGSPMPYIMHKTVALCLSRHWLLYPYSPEIMFLVANEEMEFCGSGI